MLCASPVALAGDNDDGADSAARAHVTPPAATRARTGMRRCETGEGEQGLQARGGGRADGAGSRGRCR
eukprot:7997506-Alexandrium_andersonii.AAC.1